MEIVENFFQQIRKHPSRFFIIHYSSQSLFDSDHQNLSPRITSIVVRHYETGQAVSFSLHTVAEYLGVLKDDIQDRYDDIERELLKQFYEFVLERRDRYWVHWNMRNVVYGFEHLEHRYRVLNQKDPPTIPVENRINLNDVLKRRFGGDYAPDPRMPSLMEFNGGLVQGFLTGKEEAEAFAAKDFIRMHTSTIAKVGFFSHVISAALKGKLRTKGSGFLNWVDKALESRRSRVVAAGGTVMTLVVGAIQLAIWLK
jgi:hypothetical protein